MGTGTPDCKCHGEPMYWCKAPNQQRKAGGFWQCGVRQRAQVKRHYDALDGVARNLLLLKHRRTKALARRRLREA